MYKVDIENLSNMLGDISNYELVFNNMIYRGQAFPKNLLPGIARKDPKADTTNIEREMLHEFRRIGALKTRDHDQDDLSMMILAQHYGMKTRLLDWTSNPLAALWFACADQRPGKAYVYAADSSKVSRVNSVKFDPFDIENTMIIRPNLGNDRIVAQHGWFTLHRYSKRSGKFVALENMDSNELTIETEFIIPEFARPDILKELNSCGINQSTLQPDLAGLCGYLNWQNKV